MTVGSGGILGFTPARRVAVWLALAACIALFVALRTGGVGHLLYWDEATDVCAARALASGGSDHFSPRIWMHPPALPVLSLFVQPLKPGFDTRYEMLVLTINACAMIALFLLNRRIYGTALALWSCVLLAVMPGAIYYDVWIKGGAIVSLATLGAVAALMGGKPLLSGLCLGLALLDKETAVFPCVAVGILALLDRRSRNVNSIAGLVAATLLTSGWWYALLATATKYYVVFATASDAHGRSWTMPWHQYLTWLHCDVGTAGCVLLVFGVLHVCSNIPARTVAGAGATYAWWPCALLVPAYTVLSATPAKASWILMFQYPALATLQAAGVVGVAGLLGMYAARNPRVRHLRHLWTAAAALCAAAMLVHATIQQYEQRQKRHLRGTYAHAERTRGIALEACARIAPGESLLMGTLSFHGRSFHDKVSPLFAFYETNAVKLPISFLASFDLCAAFIVSDRLDWALLTPEPGASAAAITNGFKTRFNLDPIILDNGTSFLYRIPAVSGEH